MMLYPRIAHIFSSEVRLATVLDEGLIWVTGTVGRFPGSDTLAESAVTALKKVSCFIGSVGWMHAKTDRFL
jgi:hypothetical protein